MNRPAVAVPSARRAAGGRRVGQVLAHTAYRPDVLDLDKVPERGPLLLAANHTGVLDGPLVYGLAPRPVHFLVKVELFHGFVGWVLERCGQIPVDRSGVDRAALQAALVVLRRGGVVGVFPEGSRGRGDVAAVYQGVTWLAMASGAPVLPVACLGTRPAGYGVGRLPAPRRRVGISFGDPLHLMPDPATPRRVDSRRLTEQLRRVLAQHVTDSSQRLRIPMFTDHPAGALEDAS